MRLQHTALRVYHSEVLSRFNMMMDETSACEGVSAERNRQPAARAAGIIGHLTA